MAKRTFIVEDRDDLATLIADLEGSIFQLGGTFSVGAHRQEVAEGQFETVAFLVQYDSHSPAQKLEPKEGAEVATG